MNNIEKIRFIGNDIDPFGRVFFVDDRVFRGVRQDYKDFCEKLLGSPLMKELTDKNLIPKTTIAVDYKMDEFPLVLEHEKVIYTQPSEWVFSMLKDVGLAILEVNEICKKYGYCLKDGHPWNVAFKNNRPMFLDLGSIVSRAEDKENWFLQEFKDTICYPLLLWSQNEEMIAQAFLTSPYAIYKQTIPKTSMSQSSLIKSIVNSLTEPLEANEKFVKSLSQPRFVDTAWRKYQDEFFSELTDEKLYSRFPRFKRIKELIEEFSADTNTVLDLAGNAGAMAFCLDKDKKYEKIINVDYDENAIEFSYKRLKELDSKVETYLLNFVLPKQHNIAEYLKCDTVLALAITHHLLLSQYLFNLDLILDKIGSFAKKYVYVEFMPLGLWGGGELPGVPQWYTEDWFRNNFVKKFDLLHREQLEKNRIIYIGKIRAKK